MRGIIFCVHLAGVGHIERMMTLAKSLLKYSELTFIQAGREEGITCSDPRLKHITLPFSYDFIRYYFNPTPETFAAIVEQFKMRRKLIFRQLDFMKPYDFIITEQIPFTKIMFWNEVSAILQAAKKLNPNVALISSQKGATPIDTSSKGPRSEEEMEKLQLGILERINPDFDKILVHCDPKISKLEDAFDHCDAIRDKIEYTGYISKQVTNQQKKREKKIIVTTGGGQKGASLIEVLIKVFPLIPDYEFYVVKGPLTQMKMMKFLEEAEKNVPNMKVVDFIDNFSEKLSECSMAITLAGSTLINLYVTRTPALVYPDPDDTGQLLLGKKFHENDIVHLIQPDDFNPEKLKERILYTLKNPPQFSIDLDVNGVENSVKAILKTVREKQQRKVTV